MTFACGPPLKELLGRNVARQELSGQYFSAAAVGGRVYGFGVGRVLRVQGSSGEIDLIGPELGGEIFCASAVVGRCAYGLPCRSPHLLRVDEGGEVDIWPLGRRWTCGGGFPAAVLNQRIYAFPRHPGQVIRITSTPTSSAHVKRLINRWGPDMASPLAGPYEFYPDGFRPVHAAAECIDHVTFRGQAGVVQLAQYEASTYPAEVRGQVMVIHAYTQNSKLFEEVTEAMRRREAASLRKWREYIYHLEAALRQQPVFVGNVFRGLEIRVRLSVYMQDTYITWQSFSSATRRAIVIVEEDFVKVTGRELSGTIFIIRARSARRVEDLSEFKHEDEVVFQPNSMFRVVEQVNDNAAKMVALPDLVSYDLDALLVLRLEEVP